MTRISEKNITKKTPTLEDTVFGGDTENFGGIVRYDIDALINLFINANRGISHTNLIYNEVPIGLINGVNSIFTSVNNFIPEKIEIYLNGFLQKIINDYQTIGTNTIQLNFSPNVGETLLINYIKI